MGKKYEHLSIEERTMIQLGLEQGCTWRAAIGLPPLMDGPLWPIVEDLLRQRHSPEQIAGILARMHPDSPTPQISHETIYTAIYAMPRGELRSELSPACASRARRDVRVLAARIVAESSPT